MPRPEGLEGTTATQWIISEVDAMMEAIAVLDRKISRHPAITERAKRIKEAAREIELDSEYADRRDDAEEE